MIANWIYEWTDPPLAFILLYVVILVLSIIVYQLGFARKLPVLKAAIVYICLAFGCIFITLLGTGLPMADSLFVAVVLLVVMRWRLRDRDPEQLRSRNKPNGRDKKKKEEASNQMGDSQ